MPALIGSGRLGHASMIDAKSASISGLLLWVLLGFGAVWPEVFAVSLVRDCPNGFAIRPLEPLGYAARMDKSMDLSPYSVHPNPSGQVDRGLRYWLMAAMVASICTNSR